MTCIVGLLEQGVTYIAGDSCGTGPAGERFSFIGKKVWRQGEWVFGIAGELASHRLIELELAKGIFLSNERSPDAIVDSMLERFRATLAAADQLGKGQDGRLQSGFTMLIGCVGRLFLIDESLGWMESAHGYQAIGCAAPEALGAMAAQERLSLAANVRLWNALSAAARHDVHVAPPFWVVSTQSVAVALAY